VEHYNKLSGTSGVNLGALPVVVKEPLGKVECLAFLDDGSTATLIEENIAKQIGLEGVNEPFCMKTITSVKHHANSKLCGLTISGAWDNSKQYSMEGAGTIDTLDLDVMREDSEDLKNKWPYLSKLPLPSFNEKLKMLIEMKHCFYAASRQIISAASDQQLPFKCRLRWSVGGQQGADSAKKESFFHLCENQSSDDNLHQLVNHSFFTELRSKGVCRKAKVTRGSPSVGNYEENDYACW